jgi:hypothetical protein
LAKLHNITKIKVESHHLLLQGKLHNSYQMLETNQANIKKEIKANKIKEAKKVMTIIKIMKMK